MLEPELWSEIKVVSVLFATCRGERRIAENGVTSPSASECLSIWDLSRATSMMMSVGYMP